MVQQEKKTARHGKVAEAEADGFFSMAKRRLYTAKQLKQKRMNLRKQLKASTRIVISKL
jgi:hypothetical protein